MSRVAEAVRAAWPRRAVIVVLALILAVQAGRIVWIFVQPPTAAAGAPAAAPAADLAVLERFDPFAAAPAAEVEDAPAAPLASFQLYGVRPGASAIIGGPGLPQRVFRLGETVAPGVTLKAVTERYAILRQNGADVRIVMGREAGGMAPPVSYTSPPAKAP